MKKLSKKKNKNPEIGKRIEKTLRSAAFVMTSIHALPRMERHELCQRVPRIQDLLLNLYNLGFIEFNGDTFTIPEKIMNDEWASPGFETNQIGYLGKVGAA